MHPRLTVAWLLTLAVLPFAAAQNFSGSDTFSSTSGNWTTTSSASGGSFTVNLGLLNYHDAGTLASVTSTAQYVWNANVGSYTADWQVQIDFKLPAAANLVPGQFTSWNLAIFNSSDTNDYFTAGLENNYMYTMPKVTAAIVTNGGTPTQTSQEITSTTSATLLIAFTASTQTLAARFNDGSGLTNLFSASVSDSGSNWNMVAGSTFALSLAAKNSAMAMPTATLADGDFTADNFLASGGTPVPEPSTYALLAGLAVLGVVVWRRRA